jgi:hypothetical protein
MILFQQYLYFKTHSSNVFIFCSRTHYLISERICVIIGEGEIKRVVIGEGEIKRLVIGEGGIKRIVIGEGDRKRVMIAHYK